MNFLSQRLVSSALCQFVEGVYLTASPRTFRANFRRRPRFSFGRSDVRRTSGRSDVRMLGRSDARTSGRPGVRMPGRSDACPPLFSIFAFVAARARAGPRGRAGRAAPPWRRPSPRRTQKLRKTNEKQKIEMYLNKNVLQIAVSLIQSLRMRQRLVET